MILGHFQNDSLYLECQIFNLRKSNNAFFYIHFPIFPSKFLECNLIINKFNMTIRINIKIFMKKFKIITSIPLI